MAWEYNYDIRFYTEMSQYDIKVDYTLLFNAIKEIKIEIKRKSSIFHIFQEITYESLKKELLLILV